MRRALPLFIFLLAGVLLGYVWLRTSRPPAAPHAGAAPTAAGAAATASSGPGGPSAATASAPRANVSSAAVPSAPPASFNPADFPIVAALNGPDSTIAKDLDAMQMVFETWRTHYPHEGNPVGENAEITAALMGDNRLGIVLVPKGHRAVNDRGELCDRWGTPFRFHQLSGAKMEVRSAGPDRRFATGDDVVLTPH